MEPKFQSSFIPKKPIGNGSEIRSAPIYTGNIFSTVATALFIVTILGAGGIFAYEQYLNSQIDAVNKQILDAKNAFKPESIQSLLDIDSRISSTQQLLQKHVAVSELFGLIQDLTVKKVKFNNFSFSNTNNALNISMDVEAQSYNALAEQSDIFAKDTFLKNPQFFGFDLAENGNIKAKFTATVDPTLISYQKKIQKDTSAQ